MIKVSAARKFTVRHTLSPRGGELAATRGRSNLDFRSLRLQTVAISEIILRSVSLNRSAGSSRRRTSGRPAKRSKEHWRRSRSDGIPRPPPPRCASVLLVAQTKQYVFSPLQTVEMSIDTIFKKLDEGLKADPSVVKRVQGIYAFNITGTDGAKFNYIVDLKNGNGSVSQGAGASDCTITISAPDFVDLMSGKLNGQQAFMGGKLKIGGNMMLAMKLSELTKSLNAAPKAAAAPAAAAPAAAGKTDGLAAVFAQVRFMCPVFFRLAAFGEMPVSPKLRRAPQFPFGDYDF